MYFFVCEFITGGGMQHEELPPQLVREGDMMLKSLLSDLQEAGIKHLLSTRDPRLKIVDGNIKLVPTDTCVWDLWRKCMQESEAVWIIAPETDGVLYELTRMAHTAGCLVIGSTPEAVQLAASKNNTQDYLDSHNIPCIPVINDFDIGNVHGAGWVAKPDDGVGSEGCCYFPDARQTLEYIQSQRKRMIVQKFVPGIPASMSLLCHAGQVRLLACNRQLFRFTEGKGHLEGVVVNGLPEYFDQLETLAQGITDIFPGLQGYVGVDVIIADNDPLVVEINPRLTTAYAGLRQSLGANPAEWVLSVFKTGHMPEIDLLDRIPVTVCI
jgi:predicted ATP-grasp superfamily ATP-dependent carboligase